MAVCGACAHFHYDGPDDWEDDVISWANAAPLILRPLRTLGVGVRAKGQAFMPVRSPLAPCLRKKS